MSESNSFPLIWLTGASCDGCTIRAIGDTAAGGLEALLSGTAPSLPPVSVLHPLLSMESGTEFVNALNATVEGKRGSYGLIVEASFPNDETAAPGAYATMGEEDGKPISVVTWLHRLAPGAAFVIAWGDCAVWGGPHAVGVNPSGASGVTTHLGWDFRSTRGLPVVHLPGCAPPAVLLGTLASLIRWMAGEGEPLELDSLNRPRGIYETAWVGAFAAWDV